MIGLISGKLIYKNEDFALISCNGVGFQVYMTGAELSTIKENIFYDVHTYLYVREDTLTLYGFLTIEEKEMFLKLISVSGIGPKVALGILSVFRIDELCLGIISEDYKTLSKAPGLGKKTIAKLILELKDKIDIRDTINFSNDKDVYNDNANNELFADCLMALTALGYSESDGFKLLSSIEIDSEDTVEALLKKALSQIN